MMTNFNTWSTAPEYRFARAIINHLREDEALAPLVYDAPYDRADQCQMLGATAQRDGGIILVTPHQIDDDNPEARARVLRAEMYVTILATNQLTATDNMTAAEVVATIRARVLHRLCGWLPAGKGIPHTEPKLEGCVPLDTENYKGWENLTGSVIVLTQNLLY